MALLSDHTKKVLKEELSKVNRQLQEYREYRDKAQRRYEIYFASVLQLEIKEKELKADLGEK